MHRLQKIQKENQVVCVYGNSHKHAALIHSQHTVLYNVFWLIDWLTMKTLFTMTSTLNDQSLSSNSHRLGSRNKVTTVSMFSGTSQTTQHVWVLSPDWTTWWHCKTHALIFALTDNLRHTSNSLIFSYITIEIRYDFTSLCEMLHLNEKLTLCWFVFSIIFSLIELTWLLPYYGTPLTVMYSAVMPTMLCKLMTNHRINH